MRAATIHVDTNGIDFTVEAEVGENDGCQLKANAPTLHGALHRLAEKIETIAKGGELPESRMERALERIADARPNEYDRDTLKAVLKILNGTEDQS